MSATATLTVTTQLTYNGDPTVAITAAAAVARGPAETAVAGIAAVGCAAAAAAAFLQACLPAHHQDSA